MCSFTRREILKMFSMALPATLLGSSIRDHFDDERVCVHVFNPTISLPKPLLARSKNLPDRPKQKSFFQIGIPELVLCSKSTSFLDMFQYFWPITKKEFRQWRETFSVLYAKSEISGRKDIDEFASNLEKQKEAANSDVWNMAVILTFNDYTRYWSPRVLELWRNAEIGELVIFKDPTRSPYLCDYPSLQKGFKRPPP